MQFRDLNMQYKALKPDIDNAIFEVITEANFISGKQVQELEEELAKYVGVEHCISCANGTDALSLVLMAWNVKEGDAIFVPDFTFFSSGEVVSYTGATPVFVDVYEDTFNISIEKLEMAVEKVIKEGKLNPKAIIAVDLFGQPAEYSRIKEIADRFNLLVLEDAAQGFGGSIGKQKACSFGDVSTTSFFPAKPLGCYGDGGAIFTNNEETARLLRSLAVHGKGESKYDNIRIGMNSRLDTIQAAILIPKFKAFKEYELEAVNRIAERYSVLLKDCVKIPVVKEGYYSSWAQYTIQLKNSEQRNDLQEILKDNGIPSMIYYQKPMREQEAFATVKVCEESQTIDLCNKVLSLPMHPYLKDEEVDKICEVITSYIAN